MDMYVMKWDDSIVGAMDATQIIAYKEDLAEHSKVFFKSKLKPSNGWAVPYVTGHEYKIHWANGLDFTGMKLEVSERWLTTDKSIIFHHNFTNTR